jgi:tetratricopeptide (TPR) repeat protein
MEWLYAKGIPIEAQFLYRKALDFSLHGRDEEALKYFRQSVLIAPGYARALFEMGNCFARLGRLVEAREKYDQALHLHADSPRT